MGHEANCMQKKIFDKNCKSSMKKLGSLAKKKNISYRQKMEVIGQKITSLRQTNAIYWQKISHQYLFVLLNKKRNFSSIY